MLNSAQGPLWSPLMAALSHACPGDVKVILKPLRWGMMGAPVAGCGLPNRGIRRGPRRDGRALSLCGA